MLNTQIVELLNNKINDEFYRSNLFLEISGWASDLSLKGVQGYFLNKSAAALSSANALFEYVNHSGAEVSIGAIKEGIRDFDNVEDLFVYVSSLEQAHTADLNNLLDTCLAEKDFATYANLESQVSTQHSDEFFLKSVLDKISIIGYKGQGLYLLDKELAESFPAPVETQA